MGLLISEVISGGQKDESFWSTYGEPLKESRNFVLFPEAMSGECNIIYSNKISFPFDYCFFEFSLPTKNGEARQGVFANQKLDLQDSSMAPYTKRETYGVLVIQKNPELLVDYKFCKANDGKGITVLRSESPLGDALSSEVAFAYKYLNEIHNYEYGTSKYKERIKTPKGQIEINKIIYIRKKKSEQTDGTRVIDWSHRFEVMGHWRKISNRSIGKDRRGEYVLIGQTWISNHIKGNGNLVIKTRVNKGETEYGFAKN